MKNTNPVAMDPWIEGYLSYLDKVGRKTPRTVIDVRCTLRRAIRRFETVRPGVALWHLQLEDYLHWLEAERQGGCTESTLAKYLSHVRGLLDTPGAAAAPSATCSMDSVCSIRCHARRRSHSTWKKPRGWSKPPPLLGPPPDAIAWSYCCCMVAGCARANCVRSMSHM